MGRAVRSEQALMNAQGMEDARPILRCSRRMDRRTPLLHALGFLPEIVCGSPPCRDPSTVNSKGRGVVSPYGDAVLLAPAPGRGAGAEKGFRLFAPLSACGSRSPRAPAPANAKDMRICCPPSMAIAKSGQ